MTLHLQVGTAIVVVVVEGDAEPITTLAHQTALAVQETRQTHLHHKVITVGEAVVAVLLMELEVAVAELV
jgi:hypothetical protein